MAAAGRAWGAWCAVAAVAAVVACGTSDLAKRPAAAPPRVARTVTAVEAAPADGGRGVTAAAVASGGATVEDDKDLWWLRPSSDPDFPPVPSTVSSGVDTFGQGWAAIGNMPGCSGMGATCDHFSSKVPLACVPRRRAGNDPTIRYWVSHLEATGIDPRAIQRPIERMPGVRECLLEGYRVKPRDRGFIHLRAKYYPHGCRETSVVLESSLPDAMSRDCLDAEITGLILRTGGHAISFDVRIDYEATLPPKRGPDAGSP